MKTFVIPQLTLDNPTLQYPRLSAYRAVINRQPRQNDSTFKVSLLKIG